MKNYVWGGLIALALVSLVAGFIYGIRAFNQAAANLVIREVEPGIHCAVLVDRRRGGNAMSCYESTNPVPQ